MTGQMLRYRAAAWWANVYCPEIALGLMTHEEALDIEPVTVREAGGSSDGGPVVPAAAAPPPRGSTGAGRPAAVPQLLRIREDISSPEQTMNAVATTADSLHGADQGGPAAIIGAQLVTPASAPAQAQADASGDQQAPPPSRRSRSQSVAAAAAPAAGMTRARAATTTPPAAEAIAAAPVPAPAPAPIAAPAPDPQAPGQAPAPDHDPIEAGLRQIPRIATLLELDGAYGRVNQLLAAGRIHDGQAEQLWSAIARRRQQLEQLEQAELSEQQHRELGE